MNERDQHINAARVYLAESRSRSRRQRAFGFTLLQWAANARRRAMAVPVQGELFGREAV